MFRSPNDVTSTSDASSSSEEDVGFPNNEARSRSVSEASSNLVGSALEPQETASESIQGDRTGPSADEESWIPSTTDEHAAMVTAASLEFMYTQIAAERLNAENGVTSFTRHSAEARERGRQMYMQTSQQLASAGVGSGEAGDHFLRQQYAIGLEHLGTHGRETLSNLDLNVANQSGRRTPPQRTVSSLLLQSGTAGQDSFVNPGPLPPHVFQYASVALPRTSSIVQSSSSQISIPRPPSTRYKSEFQEIQALGRGGYGIVYHVVNFVDNQHYAVKKIPLNARLLKKWRDGGKKEIEKILKEIRTLARLDHQNIVRYYGAWIEHQQPGVSAKPRPPPNTRAFRSASSDSSPLAMNNMARGTMMEQDIIFEVSSDQEIEKGKIEEISDGNDIVFGFSNDSQPHSVHINPAPSATRPRRESQATSRSTQSRKSYVRSTGSDDEQPEDIEADDSPESPSAEQTSTLGFANSEDVFTDGNAGPRSQLIKKGQHDAGEAVVLHIQMSLHPLSLVKYLQTAPPPPSDPWKARHCFHVKPSLKLFLAIIDGVEYLHTQGIVHRDLKPGNIFLSAHDMPGGGCVEVGNCPECLSAIATAGPSHHRSRFVTPRIGDFGLVAEIISNATTNNNNTEPATPDAAPTAGKTTPSLSSNPIPTPNKNPPTTPSIISSPIDVALSSLTLSPPRPPRSTTKKTPTTAAPRVVGTEFYRPPPTTAPPSSSPNSNSNTTPTSSPSPSAKLDIFALGVILFELLYPFSTRMERMMVLKNLTTTITDTNTLDPSSSSAQRLPSDFPASDTVPKADATAAKLRDCVLGMVDGDADTRWSLERVRDVVGQVVEGL